MNKWYLNFFLVFFGLLFSSAGLKAQDTISKFWLIEYKLGDSTVTEMIRLEKKSDTIELFRADSTSVKYVLENDRKLRPDVYATAPDQDSLIPPKSVLTVSNDRSEIRGVVRVNDKTVGFSSDLDAKMECNGYHKGVNTREKHECIMRDLQKTRKTYQCDSFHKK